MAAKKELAVIGRAERVEFPECKLQSIPARIDTGAKTSSLWASDIALDTNGELSFVFFGKESELYTGNRITVPTYELRNVASSTGEVQERYVVKLLVEVGGRRIRASFSLADRSSQVYPVLIGRNVLRGRFLVDVKRGEPLVELEHRRSRQLQNIQEEVS